MAERRGGRASSGAGQPGAPTGPTGPIGERELIVVTQREAGLRVARDAADMMSFAGADVSPLAQLLQSENVTMVPLFGSTEDRVRAAVANYAAETAVAVPDLSVYYRVEAPDDRLDALAERLRDQDLVEAAYVKPPAEPAQLSLNDMVATAADAPPVTPDFTARQGYLDVAPGGIDARFAWTQAGGSGANVQIIDIEGAWRFSHEDLQSNQGGVVGGTPSSDIRWRNHGTAVVGEFGGDRGAIGITGICPDANVRAISIFGGSGSANAIRTAADMLRPGDILLIELHRPGPRHDFESRDDQAGYIAVEWWEDDYAAIRYATGRGVIVVEAAGNGAQNLDDAIYSVRPPGFPATWTNPFNRANRDSRAIVVGAGAPPPGTHGRDHGPDRSRLDFSNFGALIDAQGWGREVTTTGYGDLQGGASEDEWYTDRFSGTSSASPIVVGALGCVQGVLRAESRPLLTPARARQLLRSTGSAQQDAPGRPTSQRIGNRPSLRPLIDQARGIKKIEVKEGKPEKIEIKEGKDKIEIKEGKDKVEIKEGKVEVKEGKDKVEIKEKIEIKEGKDKVEIKEGKQEKIEVKEGPKELKDIREKLREKLREVFHPGVGQSGAGYQDATQLTTEERLARIEAAIAQQQPAPQSLISRPQRRCVDLNALPVGPRQNPLQFGGMRFTVLDFTGQTPPTSRIVNWGGFTGLDCSFTLAIDLGQPCDVVDVSLVHFAYPAAIDAYDANGTHVASATMSGPQGMVETLQLQGAGIAHVSVRAPRNETILVQICCIRFVKGKEKPEIKEKGELKERPKELKELSDVPGGAPYPPGQGQGDGPSIEDRLARIESSIGQSAHFIGAELRPDLSSGALNYETDLSGAASQWHEVDDA